MYVFLPRYTKCIFIALWIRIIIVHTEIHLVMGFKVLKVYLGHGMKYSGKIDTSMDWMD